MTRALITIGAVAALTYATRSFVPRGATITGSGAALAFGFLLITAVQMAKIFDHLRLPHLTAYILCGLVFGPEVVGLVSAKMLPDLALVKGTAVALIAFLAGCELNLQKLRPKLRAIGVVSALTMLCASVLLFAFFFGVAHLLPVTKAYTTLEKLVVALVAANVLTAFSPAVVVGILSETRARGPLSEMAMSIVVLADLFIVLTYALSNSIAHAFFPASSGAGGLGTLIPHIFGSIGAGAVAGVVLAVYVTRVGARSGIFAFALLFVATEAGAALHLNPLLVGLAAGLLLENLTEVGGERLSRDVSGVAIPTFAIFFAVVGAELHLTAFLHVAPFAIAGALIRAVGILAGTYAAARILGLDRDLSRRLPFGLFPQAGVAIALASLVLGDYPPWGPVVGTVLLGTIVVNELIAPVLFRSAVIAAGEANLTETTRTSVEAGAPPVPASP